MKLLFVIDQIVHGGAERILVDYYHYLEERGVELRVFVLSGNKDQSVWTQGLNVHYAADADAAGLIGKLKKSLGAIRQLKKLHEEFAPDAVFSFLEKSNVLTSFLPDFSQKVFSVHNVLSIQYLKIKNGFVRSLWFKFIRSRYNSGKGIVLAVSEQVKEDLIFSFGVDPDKIIVVNNRVNRLDITEKSKEFVTDFYFDPQTSYIINVGRFSRQKAQWRVIKAFSLCHEKIGKKNHLVLMGDGEYKEKLLYLIKELNVENAVTVLPFNINPYKYISKSSLFVLSSSFEGFPIVLSEASSLRIPFVGSRKSIPKEFFSVNDVWEECIYEVNDKNAEFSVSLENEDYVLADLMRKGVEDESFRQKILRNTLEWEQDNDKFVQFHRYDKLVNL